MVKKVLVSFKNKEKELYDVVSKQGDKSNFMKDALKFYLQNKNQGASNKETPKNEEVIDIFESI